MIFIFLLDIFIPGIRAAREEYEKLLLQPPNSLEFHKKMATLEYIQPKVSLKHARRPYEVTTQHFGTNNTSVWMDYINFEMKHGDPKKVGDIYERAVKMLDRNLTYSFIADYSLIIAKPDSIK